MNLKQKLQDKIDLEFVPEARYVADGQKDEEDLYVADEIDQIDDDYYIPPELPVDVAMRRQGERW